MRTLSLASVSLFLVVALAVAGPAESHDALDRLQGAETKLRMLGFRNTSLQTPLRALAGAGQFELELGAGVAQVVVELDDDEEEVTVKQALKRLARRYHLVYTVPAHDKLTVDLKARPRR